MKTTLDIPDDLMRQVKLRAVQKNQKLKDTVAELLKKGIGSPDQSGIKLLEPVKLKKSALLTIDDIEAAISRAAS